MEVLAPSMVPQVPKWVPILDKPVASKVFKDVGMLEITKGGRMISEKNTKSPRMCNPNAISLKTYEAKLEKFMEKVQSRILNVVKAALPEEEIEALPSNLNYQEHKTQILQALETSKSTLAETELPQLENELSKAKKYLERSKEIREMAEVKSRDVKKPKSCKSKAKNLKKEPKQTKESENEILDSKISRAKESVGAIKGQRPRSTEVKGVTFKDPPVEYVSITKPLQAEMGSDLSSHHPRNSRPTSASPRITTGGCHD
jgi:hypothetical protein